MSFQCKFCKKEYQYVDGNVVPTCCNEAYKAKGNTAIVEVKVKKK